MKDLDILLAVFKVGSVFSDLCDSGRQVSQTLEKTQTQEEEER